jgi:hypothetical protein
MTEKKEIFVTLRQREMPLLHSPNDFPLSHSVTVVVTTMDDCYCWDAAASIFPILTGTYGRSTDNRWQHLSANWWKSNKETIVAKYKFPSVNLPENRLEHFFALV